MTISIFIATKLALQTLVSVNAAFQTYRLYKTAKHVVSTVAPVVRRLCQ